jgi:hypothetical protein
VTSPITWASNIANHLKLVLSETREPIELDEQTTPAERQILQEEFFERYEDLVDVLVSAAQYGVKPSCELTYDQLRTVLAEQYIKIQPFVLAYLKADPEDEHFGITKFKVRTDAFQVLWVAPSISEFLSADDGNMIDRISRTREALSHYGEHLRYLVTRSA